MSEALSEHLCAGTSATPSFASAARAVRSSWRAAFRTLEPICLVLWLALLALVWRVDPALEAESRLARGWACVEFYLRTFQLQFAVAGGVWVASLLLRSRNVLGSIVALTAALCAVPELRIAWPAIELEPAPQAHRFRIMSINQLRGNTDTAATQLAIRASDPDVIAFQEFASTHDAQLTAALRDAYPYSARYPFPVSNGLAIYSKRAFKVDRPPMIEWMGARAMEISFEIEGARVRLYNIHPTSPGFPSRITQNRRQTAELVRSIRDTSSPTLVVGDCNFPRDSQQADALRGIGLTHVDEYSGSGFRWSWSPLRDGPPVTRIDHAFLSDHFAVSRNWIGGGVGSDHRPIVIDVSLRPVP